MELIINQTRADLTIKMRESKIIDCRKPVCRQKQTKTADIVKITPGKTHNRAANKAPFTSRVRLAA